jgi:hypothetical protein
MVDRELSRRNNRLGWLLFGIFLLLFAGTWGVAFLYLHFD